MEGILDFSHLLQCVPLIFIAWKEFPEYPLYVVGGLEIPDLAGGLLKKGKSRFSTLIHPKDSWATRREKLIFLENKGLQGVFCYRLSTESVVWVQEWVIYNLREEKYQSVILDIIFWKEREQGFLYSQKLDQDFLEASPVALWEEDFSALKSYVDGLKGQGIKDLEKYLDSHRREVVAIVRKLQITRVDAKAPKLSGARSRKEFLKDPSLSSVPTPPLKSTGIIFWL